MFGGSGKKWYFCKQSKTIRTMNKNKSYPICDEEDDCVLAAQEPAVAYIADAVALPEDMDYARIKDGVLQVTSDIEEEIAAADRGETVSLEEFKTMFSR